MARKHQSMIAYHIHDANILRPKLSLSRMTQVAVEVLKDSIKESFVNMFPRAAVLKTTHTPKEMSVQLRVIIEESNIRKLTLPSGIPNKVEDLVSEIIETFQIQDESGLSSTQSTVETHPVDDGEEYSSLADDVEPSSSQDTVLLPESCRYAPWPVPF
ncbi:hypothetical protein DPX16_1812 [Anabarilius grahami]|uniref:Uncharacterized protein n=1 Tax=Anabarilius grahami TaxID=495550 RepID=A0A3N0Y6W7_ANAGA|nr:hypothetical protein DPX16_1812 [Anabarilius grahami]